MRSVRRILVSARDDDRGVVFLIAMFAVALVFLLGSAIVSATSDDLTIAHNARRGEVALNVAEAGLDYARHYLTIYPDFNGTLGPKTVGEGSFTATVASNGRLATVTATAAAGTARRAIQAQVQVQVGGDNTLNNKALVVNSSLITYAKLFIYGDAYVDGDVIIDNGLVIGALGTARGDLNLATGHTITDPGRKLSVAGTIYYDQNITLPPLLTLDFYRTYATRILAGPQTFQDVLDMTLPANRLILIEGDVHLGAASALRIKGKGTIVATGNIWIDNKSYYYTNSATDKLFVFGLDPASRLVFNTASQFIGIYRVPGNVDCTRSQPSSIEGAIIAASYTMGGAQDSFKIYLDPYSAANPTAGVPGTITKVLSWQEISP